jgi:hypothetical protein
MTAIIGVLCTDGVVVGADSSATFVAGEQFRTIEQPTQKISIIAEQVVVAGTGEIGLDQRFGAVIEKAWREKVFRVSPIEAGKKLAHMGIEDFKETCVQPGHYGALVAFPCEKQPCLCELSVRDFQPELKNERIWYCSMGSAQPITDPFLALMRKVFWREGRPNVADGIFAVTWALQHAIEVNPGGVNAPISIAVLEREQDDGDWKARLLDKKDLDQHEQNVDGALAHLREYRQKHDLREVPDSPAPPRAG